MCVLIVTDSTCCRLPHFSWKKGLECRVYTLDLPCPGLYRFMELFHVKLPKEFDSYLLLRALGRLLTLKVQKRRIIIQVVGRTPDIVFYLSSLATHPVRP